MCTEYSVHIQLELALPKQMLTNALASACVRLAERKRAKRSWINPVLWIAFRITSLQSAVPETNSLVLRPQGVVGWTVTPEVGRDGKADAEGWVIRHWAGYSYSLLQHKLLSVTIGFFYTMRFTKLSFL